jgi:hypothetical protein
MDRVTFETELREQGYGEVVDRHMAANTVNPSTPTNSMPVCSF